MSPPTAQAKRAARLLMAAIGELEKYGPTLETLTRHITEEYHVPVADIRRVLPACIERGIAFGAIKRKRGKYEIGAAFDDSRRRKKAPPPPPPRKKAKGGKSDKAKGTMLKRLKHKCRA